MSWVNVAIIVISAVLTFALSPKPPRQRPASLTDFEFPTAEEGRPIPVVFGTVVIRSPNVTWYGDLAYSPVKTKSGK